MVEEPSHVKQTSSSHVCRIRLILHYPFKKRRGNRMVEEPSHFLSLNNVGKIESGHISSGNSLWKSREKVSRCHVNGSMTYCSVPLLNFLVPERSVPATSRPVITPLTWKTTWCWCRPPLCLPARRVGRGACTRGPSGGARWRHAGTPIPCRRAACSRTWRGSSPRGTRPRAGTRPSSRPASATGSWRGSNLGWNAR
jgi:hypothetical protein